MTQHKIVETEDGSFTLFSTEIGEHYHSTKGALQESQHVFIKEGLLHYISNNPHKKRINILEMGFGTGLNALLALKVGIDYKLEIFYTTIEKYPIPINLAQKLNCGQLFGNKGYVDYYNQLHFAEWNVETKINIFYLNKIQTDITDYLPQNPVDVVFFDAFSPKVQQELWSVEIFTKIYQAMTDNAVLTTYSAKGDVRRNLIASGFCVVKLQGPPGKRHILRAVKQK